MTAQCIARVLQQATRCCAVTTRTQARVLAAGRKLGALLSTGCKEAVQSRANPYFLTAAPPSCNCRAGQPVLPEDAAAPGCCCRAGGLALQDRASVSIFEQAAGSACCPCALLGPTTRSAACWWDKQQAGAEPRQTVASPASGDFDMVVKSQRAKMQSKSAVAFSRSPSRPANSPPDQCCHNFPRQELQLCAGCELATAPHPQAGECTLQLGT